MIFNKIGPKSRKIDKNRYIYIKSLTSIPFGGPIVLLNPSQLLVSAGAALAVVTFAQKCAPHGWGGMEFLIGIPGTIGGAIAMNAGAHGAETADFLDEIEWMDMDGILHSTPKDKLEFRYRYSELNGNLGKIITRAVLELNESDPETVEKKTLK